MSDERERVLRMVESGKINAAEAAELLGALTGDDSDATPALRSASAAGARPWEAPFVAGIVISGFGLLGLIRSRNSNFFGRISAWVTLLLGLAAVAVGYWSRNVPWLYINVQEANGHNIRLGLPLLLPVARAGLELARGFVDPATAEQLDSAAAFIEGLQRGEQPEPISIEVEDGDGAQVQIYVS